MQPLSADEADFSDPDRAIKQLVQAGYAVTSSEWAVAITQFHLKSPPIKIRFTNGTLITFVAILIGLAVVYTMAITTNSCLVRMWECRRTMPYRVRKIHISYRPNLFTDGTKMISPMSRITRCVFFVSACPECHKRLKSNASLLTFDL